MIYFSKLANDVNRGGARHLHLGGPLEGPVLQQVELSMVCVGLSERDLKNFWGALGGPGKILGGQWPLWHPPSSAPGCKGFWAIKQIDTSFQAKLRISNQIFSI